MGIPAFRSDGYLPDGVHAATMAEVAKRFGSSTPRRKMLMTRLKHWIGLSRRVGAKRFLIDGSFVTAKPNPKDVDAVVQVTLMYHSLLSRGDENAIKLDAAFLARDQGDFFEVDDSDDWNGWVVFFTRTREFSRVRKGIIEVLL